jgi:hypothetical protein
MRPGDMRPQAVRRRRAVKEETRATVTADR